MGVGLPLGVRLSYTFRLFPSLFHRISTMETCRKCAVSCNMLQGKCRGNGRKDSKILHQSYILHLILHPILHPELPANTEDLGHWCRKCRRFSKNFFYGGEYAYAPTYCRQRSPTQNGTGTSAGDLCAKTLKTHRGRTKFRVVFVDYAERGGRRRSQTMFIPSQ